ncbi:MAG: hypothetical protein QM820_60955 [Minicystis sp.]
MKFFDAGDNATGIIAVGQHATGFFALGQMATGVIAVGQLARGGIAIGQLAVGLVGWGQVGVGIFSAAGMVGIGGRRPLGIVLPLVPSIGRPRVLPSAVPLPAAEASGGGWIEADLARDDLGLGIFQNGQRLPVKLDRRLQKRGYEITAEGPRRVRAYVVRLGAVSVCERIAHEPPRPYQKKSFTAIAAAQLVALLVLGTVWAGAVGHDLGVMLGDMVMDDAPVKKPASPGRPGPRPRGR